MQNPLLGFAYVDPLTQSYPHNLLLESFLALGVFGLALMAALQFRLLTLAYQVGQRGNILIALIGAATFVNAWVSGSLWGSGVFFSCITLLGLQRRNQRLLQVRGRHPET